MARFKLSGIRSSDSAQPRKASQGNPPGGKYPLEVLHNVSNAIVEYDFAS